jgi:hypothetical protein
MQQFHHEPVQMQPEEGYHYHVGNPVW